LFASLDWRLVVPVLSLGSISLLSLYSFNDNNFFWRQLIWIGVATIVMIIGSRIDNRFFKQTRVLVGLLLVFCVILLALFVVGSTFKGATSWLSFGIFAFQPSDPLKLVIILILAKYLSRRHIEIKKIRHVFITALYAGIPAMLVLLQPDFGTTIILFLMWLGMILVAGISWKQLVVLFGVGAIALGGLWIFVFEDYQKDRVLSFLHPLSDIRGAGYNAYQSMVAVGSGQLIGKGFGYGTQSRLNFLPEYETDFIFAAFAEEWGFFGSIIVFGLYIVILLRIIKISMHGASNFNTLFGVGFFIFVLSHVIINIGMNIGVMPVTGITLPFISYGGSHLITEFFAIGILMGMERDMRSFHKEDMQREFMGLGSKV
jgi:rod shape determining protein RodA